MVDPSYRTALNTQFGGSQELLESEDVPLDKALVSQNVAFAPGKVFTRLGYQQAYNAAEVITALFNWISSLGNLLFWYRTSDNSVQFITISSALQSTAITGNLLGVAATFAEAGARLYCAFFTATGIGASGARVITEQSSVIVNDLAFNPPITYNPGPPIQPSVGTVTGGVHNLGYRIEYRSGFISRPSPDIGGAGPPSVATFNPVQFTASGGANLAWSLNTTWPVGAVNVYMLMTTVAGPAQYFQVPGAVQAVVGGATSTITFVVDISDDELFATGIDVSDSLFFITSTVGGTPPFSPCRTLAHGTRMVYVTTITDNNSNQAGALFISGANAYQEIAADRSLVQLPGQRDIVTAMSLDGTLYIIGPQWVYRTIDNGGDPVNWPSPFLVDGRRGTLAVRGAEVSPSGTYGWIASQDGLYYFAGRFEALPISYYQQPIWDRINWSAAQVVQIKDDPTVKTVYVAVPLDSDTSPTLVLTWDYTRGFDPDSAHFSTVTYRNFSIGAIEVVQNTWQGQQPGNAKRKELVVAPSTSGLPILRRNSIVDLYPYRDNSQPIQTLYETSLYPHQGTSGEVYQHHGADYRVLGRGSLVITAWELDHMQLFVEAPIALSALPGVVYHRGFDMVSEGVTHQIGQAVNATQDPNFDAGPPA